MKINYGSCRSSTKTNKVDKMKKKKLPIPAPVIEIGLVVLVALLIWIFVDASAKSYIENKSGGCISVVFDKPFVKGADRIVIYENGQVITITDQETVRRIADLFVVANCTALCSPGNERRIEIYHGDWLVREVRWTQCQSEYYIYECDLFHWVFPEFGDGEVSLSADEAQWLEGIIEQYK